MLDIQRQRFLNEEVLPVLEGFEGKSIVSSRRRCDDNRVNLRIAQEGIVRRAL